MLMLANGLFYFEIWPDVPPNSHYSKKHFILKYVIFSVYDQPGTLVNEPQSMLVISVLPDSNYPSSFHQEVMK